MLNKEQILKAQDITTEAIEVPEWGGSVCVKQMSGTERDAFEQELVSGKEKVNLVNIRARLCGRCISNEDGKRLFTDNEVNQLGAKSAKALDRVFALAQKLNGISDGDVEELAKNSGDDQSVGSTSD